MIKVLHIITGLEGGGAENMLTKVMQYSDKRIYEHHIISLKDEGVYGDLIKEYGIGVTCLNLSAKNLISSLIRIRNKSKEYDLVNTWLYHADFFGFLSARIFNNRPLVWNI